ncbi:predicted protein [Plenodomus lingam JN3]|uniref:Predicted protein n=1 Tax=Leptosphaeria maculans (strain JN3 / isolate v23.1.3 / race Av1-4-5-6-7-8) TaxID=985895 RepID=E4ZTE7_LEPMJ|nr:predicted protein [Plenodomus lingam JN3]CBX94803.1 predicted protein [Plenodomus lingam JN3]
MQKIPQGKPFKVSTRAVRFSSAVLCTALHVDDRSIQTVLPTLWLRRSVESSDAELVANARDVAN